MTIKSSKTLVEEAMQQIETINASEVFKMSNEDKCTLIDILYPLYPLISLFFAFENAHNFGMIFILLV